MRVSIQLAYKVPVLGPQDRRLLPSSRPARQELSAQAGAYRDRTGEGVARGARRGLWADSRDPCVSQEQWERAQNFKSVTVCSRCQVRVLRVEPIPARADVELGGESLPLPSCPRPVTHQGLPWCAFQSGYLGLGSGEDHPISGVIPGEMGRDVEV